MHNLATPLINNKRSEVSIHVNTFTYNLTQLIVYHIYQENTNLNIYTQFQNISLRLIIIYYIIICPPFPFSTMNLKSLRINSSD